MNLKKFLALFFITAFALMAVALYNGYPLVDNDSGAYIEQAIYPHFTPERTPFYGLFVRLSCLWTSLWFTIFVQCLILAYLLLKFIDLIAGKGEQGQEIGFNFSLVAVITIVSFTCVSWVVSFLTPDVFGAILLLATVLFIAERPGSIRAQVGYIFFVFLAMLMHNAHFPILLLFSSVLLAWALIKKRKPVITKSIALVSICVMVWGIMCGMNAVKKHGFTFSRGRDIMLVAKFAEDGILNTYLNDNCGKKSLQLCNYKDRIPGNITEFLTSGEGPVYKMGGWDSNRVEYKTIIHDVFTTPSYLAMFAQKSVTGTLKQITQINAPDIVKSLGKDAETWSKVKKYFADELPAYATSLQNCNALSGGSCNFVYYLFLVLSSLWMLLFYQRVMSKELAFIYCCMLLFLMVNAFVTASLSAITYRFQYRVAWLLPATNAIVILKHYYIAQTKKHSAA
jgi:hypothetical protein